MRNVLLFLGVLFLFYGCSELSGKEFPDRSAKENGDVKKDFPRDDLRVGKNEAMQMRGRRGKDDASVKISVKDLQALITSTPAENDSFVFYFASYDVKSQKEKKRYEDKLKRNVKWDDVGKKPSTLLVGFVSGNEASAMHLSRGHRIPVIPVYDLGVVCPPPPNCGCEIAQ